MIKRLLFLIIFISSLLVSKEGFGQCSPLANITFPSCVLTNTNISLTYNDSLDPSPYVINWLINGSTPPGSANNTTINYNFPNSGTYNIQVSGYSTLCNSAILIDTAIIVNNGPFAISPLPLSNPCQGQTIFLEDYIDTFNVFLLPIQYDFSISGLSISSPFVLPSGPSIIDVFATDANGCTATTTMNINATANSITPPIYIIEDVNGNENIINSCNSTDLTFTIQNPISNYTYTWDVQGSTGTGTFTQSINATTANPGYIPVSLFLYDSSSGCTIEYYDTITSVGLDLSYVGIDQELVPSCVFDSTPGSLNLPTLLWPIDNNGNITQMGPNDTIFWSIFCNNTLSQNADVVDTFWTYQDLPQLNQPDPTYPFEPDGISGFEHYWTTNSCNCINEQYYIELNLQSACGSNGGYISWKKVNDPIEAIINIPPILCVNEPETFQNNSEIGCDGNTFDANEDTLTYEWDFGNCVTLSSLSTATSSDPFPDVTYSYPEAGIYTVTMSAESYCPPIDYDTETITVYPNPIVNCTGTDECLNNITQFNANASGELATTRNYNCPPTAPFTVQVPAGGTQFTYNWSMVQGVEGTYEPGYDYTSADPKFIFNTCGIKNVSVTVTDENGCSETCPISVTVYDLPNPILSSPSPNLSICTGDLIDIIDNSNNTSSCPTNPLDIWNIIITENFGSNNIVHNQDYNSSPSLIDYSLSPICNTTDPNYPNYNYIINLTVTDDLGCSDNSPLNIDVVCEPIADFIYDDICFGAPDNGTYQFLDNSNVSATSYSWDMGDGGAGTYTGGTDFDDPNPQYIFAGTGSYYVELTITAGSSLLPCTDDVGYWIIVFESPTSSISGVNILCNGDATGSVDLILSGGTTPYTYLWNTGDITQNLSGVTSGTYSVDITDDNGCTSTQTITITEPTLLTSSITATNLLCFQDNSGTIDLTVNDGTTPYTYLWNTGDITQDLSGISAGTYSVTITDNNGCTSNQSIILTEPTIGITSSISGVNILCNGDATGSIDLSVNGGTSPYTYLWSTGDLTQDLSGLAAGTYSVDIEDDNGCTSTQSITLTEPTIGISSSITGVNILCNGDATGSVDLTLSGGTTPYTYLWNNGSTTQDLINVTSGTYSVDIEDDNGCTSTQSITLTEPTLLTSTITGTNLLCFQDNSGTIDLSINGGVSPYTYLWNNGAITQDLSGLTEGTYSVDIEDDNGCIINTSITLTEPTLLTSTITGTNLLCFQDNSGTIDLSVNGGTSPYTYLWSTGDLTQDLSGLAAGTYSVDIEDDNGCTSTQSITLTEPDVLSSIFTITINNMCFSNIINTSSQYIGSNNSTGPIIDYTWTIPAIPWNLTTTTVIPIFPTLPQDISPIDYDITLTVNGGVCGSLSTTQTITINPEPQIDFNTIPLQTQNPTCLTTQYAGNPIEIIINNSILPYDPLTNIGNTDYIEISISAGATMVVGTSIVPPGSPIYPVTIFGLLQWPSIFITYPTVYSGQICITGYNQWCPPTQICCDVLINANGIQADFVTLTREGCEGDDFWFQDNSYPVIPGNQITWCWDWSIPNGPCAVGASSPPYPQVPSSIHTQSSLSIYYNNPGIFYVNQYAFNIIYNDNTHDPLPVIVHPNPDPNFSIPTIPICKNATAYFTNSSSINALPNNPYSTPEIITNHNWFVQDLGGIWNSGSLTNVMDPIASPNSNIPLGTNDLEFTFPNSGSWKVILECESDNVTCNCVEQFETTITVNELPIANFTSVYNPTCVDNNVVFNGNTGISGGSTNSGTGGVINEWDWNFDDPYCSLPTCSLYNSTINGDANHTYTTSQSYDVSLIVTDDNNCTSLPVSNTIIVEPGVIASFTSTTECLHIPTLFDGILSSSTVDTWIWDFGGGPVPYYTPYTSHTFLSPGFHSVSLYTAQTLLSGQICYSPTITQLIYVYDLPKPDFTAPTICEGLTTYFTNNTPSTVVNTNSGLNDGTVTQYDWTFNDNGVLSYATSFPTPGNTSFTFSSANNPLYPLGYQVDLIAKDDNGCKDTITNYAQVSRNPDADITFTSIITGLEACEGDIAQISDNSTYHDFGASTFLWNVSPGPTAAIITSPLISNTTCEFINPGTYTLTLDITDANNCPATTSVVIDVWDNPTALIDPITTVCEDLINLTTPTVLTHYSIPGSGLLTQYEWTFGDATNATLLSPANGNTDHSYPCGSYNVNLEVTDANGCTNATSVPKIATINCNPTANFLPSTECLTDVSSFDATPPISILVPGTNITDYIWSFTDPLPLGSGLQTISNGPLSTLQWTFANSSSVNGFPVTLTIWDDQSPSCSGTNTLPVFVHELPTISFTAPEVCEENITTFTATSNHPISSYLWDIDPTTGNFSGISGNTDNPTNFEFDDCSPSHMVSLTVIDNNNCSNLTLPIPVEVYCNPEAIIDIDPTQAFCLNEPIQIGENSNPGSGTINYWNWDFGSNALPLTLCCSYDNSLVDYSNVGSKTISLNIKDENTCVDNTSEDIYINQLPNAYFTINSSICFGDIVEFNNQTTLGEPLNYFTSFDWEFYDPTGMIDYLNGTSQQIPNNPPTVSDLIETHDYVSNVVSTEGAYVSAQLIVTDIEGCTSTYHSTNSNPQQNIEIHPSPFVYFTVESVCKGQPLVFIDNSQMISSVFPSDILLIQNSDISNNPHYVYSMGPLNSNTDGNWVSIPSEWNLPTTPPSFIANVPVGVNVVLERESDKNCKSSFQNISFIKEQPIIDFDVSYFPNDRCGTNVEFSLFNKHSNFLPPYTFNYTISNNLGTQLSSPTNLDILNYNFDMPGIYTLEIILDNNNDCIADSIYNIYINPNPAAIFTADPTEGCEELDINFTDKSDVPNNGTGGIYSTIIRWEWNLGNGISQQINAPDLGHTNTSYMSDNSPYDVTLTVTTDSLCRNTSNTQTITASPTPIALITIPIERLGPGLYNFDGSDSKTSNGIDYATPNEFNFLWITNNDTLWDQINEVNIHYQYSSNSNYQSENDPILYDVCLILIDENSQFQCADTFCIEPGLFVDYFKGLYVPNALAPNGNSGEPAYFLPKGKSLKAYHLEIFNTWGNLVWETSAITKLDGKPVHPWKGNTLDDKPLPQGTYVWKIYAKFSDGSIWPGINNKTTGAIYLIR